MFGEFNYNQAIYYRYKTIYKTICSHIAGLNYCIEYSSPFYITQSAIRLYNYTFVFEGYIECLYDLRFIRDYQYNSFYEFTKAIREECVIIREKIEK